MTDQCKHCTSRGDLDLCKKTPCFHHENWYAVEQQKVIDSLISVAEAYIDVANDTLEHHGVPKTVNMIYAEKHLEESIKEVKG